MKQIRLHFSTASDDLDWDGFTEYLSDNIPEPEFEIDHDQTDDNDLVMIVYGDDPARLEHIVNHYTEQFGLELHDFQAEDLSAPRWQAVKERLQD